MLIFFFIQVPSSQYSLKSMFDMKGSTVSILDESLITEEDRASLTLCGQWICRKPNTLLVEVLVCCAAAVFDWDIVPTEVEMQAVCDWRGARDMLLSGRECSRGIAKSMGLVDSFCNFHEGANDRFTCWDQSRNGRFSNEGSRIDFILVDPNLKIAPGEVPLFGCSVAKNFSTKREALNAATAFGLWQPVRRRKRKTRF